MKNHSGYRETQAHLSEIRFRKNILKRKKSRKSHLTISATALLSEKRILDLKSKRSDNKNHVVADPNAGKVSLTIPHTFSFIDNYNESLFVLYEFIEIARRSAVREIHFDHSNCEKMDLGASVALDLIVRDFNRAWIRLGRRVALNGKLPDNKVSLMLKVSGLLKHLKVSGQDVPKENHLLFSLYEGAKPRSSKQALRSGHADKAATQLTEYFDQCLRANKTSLTDSGAEKLAHMVTEILNNAEDHSDSGKWYIIGHMEQSERIGRCHITFLNFGDTIYETMDTNKLDKLLRTDIEDLVNMHGRRGLLGGVNHWDKKDLWTLYALQDGVSRFTGTEGNQDRGSGTVKFIEFFLKLGKSFQTNTPPKMVILSGGSRILFDGTYTMELNKHRRKTIFFNEKNDPRVPPDKNYVQSISGYFPGTLLSMRFYLDEEYYESFTSEDHTNGGS